MRSLADLSVILVTGIISDWILAGIKVPDGKVEDVLLLGKGTFMLLLSSEECTSSLLASSPLSLHDKLIFLVKWYPDFDMAAFEDRCQVPRFPVKLSFPGLPSEFRAPQITQLGSIFGTPFEFYSATGISPLDQSGSPSLHGVSR